MKTSRVLLALIAGTALSTAASAANIQTCSQTNLLVRGMYAPEIPALETTSYSEVAALGIEMRYYLREEQELLERCRSKLDPMRFNAHIGWLERRAEQYNELVRFYSRNVSELSSAVNSGG